MIHITECRAVDLFRDPDMAGLVEEYAAECGDALYGKPAPRLEIYEGMERTGLAQCFAAYENTRLVGFAMVITSIVPHWGLAIATTESIFVRRDSHAGAGLKLAIERHAKAMGAKALYYCAPVSSRFARLLFLDVDQHRLTNYLFCRSLA